MEFSVGGNDDGEGCSAGIDVCVSATIVGIAVSTSVGLAAGVDIKPLQDVSITATRNKGIIAFPKIFTFYFL